ncbi:hypothetical protein HELRODRAFT_182102 [Helobdella robusta]|uniref:Uncharacterized protein n=1 Tax=Helobdella robusta TaxID=6412 RepID=T1FHR3_HELRO|nr:hypothetical protein HELRODRAFT_182102 [Helobdella robusta]ESN91246.1 hypothetical protein HELRODRAFT_182102 [Helobdella robusta]
MTPELRLLIKLKHVLWKQIYRYGSNCWDLFRSLRDRIRKITKDLHKQRLNEIAKVARAYASTITNVSKLETFCEIIRAAIDDVQSAKFLQHEASTLSLSLPEFSEDVDKNIMWDEFLSIYRLIFETEVEDKFPCFLADDLWKVTNCDIRFEKLSADQARFQKSVIQNSPAVLEFLEKHGNILSDVQKKATAIDARDSQEKLNDIRKDWMTSGETFGNSDGKSE